MLENFRAQFRGVGGKKRPLSGHGNEIAIALGSAPLKAHGRRLKLDRDSLGYAINLCH